MEFYRDTWVEVNLDAIDFNIAQLQKYYIKDKKLFAVVKADAYGHGAVAIARRALDLGVDHLAVATLDEAIELRLNGVECTILVLGNIPICHLGMAADYNITVTVHSLKWLEGAIREEFNDSIDVHLKIDTGMHRIGLRTVEEVLDAVHLINQSPIFKLKGIYTHLATAEEDNESYYQRQNTIFRKIIEAIDIRDLVIHIANSAATVKYPNEGTNAVRVGLMLYGLLPKKDLSIAFLRPALHLYTRIIQCKKLEPQSRVSYNGIYQTREDEWIATLPIGYADGFDRRMRGGRVYVDGEYCPIVGKICMDQTMIRCSHELKEGTVVELIGLHITADEIADRIGTINYQVVCLLSDRLPRVYKQKGEVVEVRNRRLEEKGRELWNQSMLHQKSDV